MKMMDISEMMESMMEDVRAELKCKMTQSEG
jgi:hypothetical protein